MQGKKASNNNLGVIEGRNTPGASCHGSCEEEVGLRGSLLRILGTHYIHSFESVHNLYTVQGRNQQGLD